MKRRKRSERDGRVETITTDDLVVMIAVTAGEDPNLYHDHPNFQAAIHRARALCAANPAYLVIDRS